MTQDKNKPVTMMLDIQGDMYAKLSYFATKRGMTPEEAARYIIGDFFATAPSIITGEADMPPAARLLGVIRQVSPSVTDDQRGMIEDIQKKAAQMIAAQGGATCSQCMRKLTSDEIIKGECSNCGTKI